MCRGKLTKLLVFLTILTFYNYSFALDDIKSQQNNSEKVNEVKFIKNNINNLGYKAYKLSDYKNFSIEYTKKINSKFSKELELKKIPGPVKKAPILKELKKRNIKINETFVLTDNTRANSFRIISEKEWEGFEDNLLISFDIFGQEDDDGKMKLKKQRFEFNYKFSISNFYENKPFAEYYFSTDIPTKITWKVLSVGIGKNLPLDLKIGVGYGYKWGEITKKEVYKYDVATVNLSNKRKISKLTLNQNFKVITPRNITYNKQPVYDYKSTISVPIAKNLSGTVSFDWRYQKILELNKEDWSSYSLKFGLTFFPRR